MLASTESYTASTCRNIERTGQPSTLPSVAIKPNLATTAQSIGAFGPFWFIRKIVSKIFFIEQSVQKTLETSKLADFY